MVGPPLIERASRDGTRSSTRQAGCLEEGRDVPSIAVEPLCSGHRVATDNGCARETVQAVLLLGLLSGASAATEPPAPRPAPGSSRSAGRTAGPAEQDRPGTSRSRRADSCCARRRASSRPPTAPRGSARGSGPARTPSFRIASITKTMTSAVILQLAQEGKLRLDDPVSKYVPACPTATTSRSPQLLEMRSGLYNYTNAPEMAASSSTINPTKVWTPQELLAIAFAQPAQFPAGHGLRIQQHQLRAARPHRREGGRQAAGRRDAGTAVRAARHDQHVASPRHLQQHPRAVRARLPVRQLLRRH